MLGGKQATPWETTDGGGGDFTLRCRRKWWVREIGICDMPWLERGFSKAADGDAGSSSEECLFNGGSVNKAQRDQK